MVRDPNKKLCIETFNNLWKESEFDFSKIDYLLYAINFFRTCVKKIIVKVFTKHRIEVHYVFALDHILKKSVNTLEKFFKQGTLIVLNLKFI